MEPASFQIMLLLVVLKVGMSPAIPSPLKFPETFATRQECDEARFSKTFNKTVEALKAGVIQKTQADVVAHDSQCVETKNAGDPA